ncbi:MAG: glycosyltransferase family 4 protein [Alphaproteobacteria bacterium]|nr:glycosyltransferase family 4 protein [Alphaproteobacteria bacterium]
MRRFNDAAAMAKRNLAGGSPPRVGTVQNIGGLRAATRQAAAGRPAHGRAIRVAAFTGGAKALSARFRVRQYIAPLAAEGIDVAEFGPGLGSYPPARQWQRPAWLVGSLAQRVPQLVAGWGADITLLHREMISTFYTLEGLTRRPRLLDIDDAIHLFRGARAAKQLAKRADLIIVGNDWLAEAWRRWNPRVEILPTAVDIDCCNVRPLPEQPCIGWIGSRGNLRYLETIGPAMTELVRRFPNLSIAVCCDQPPRLDGLPIRYVPWSMPAEAGFLASLSVGLMPLDDGPWERGKCSFKMLQYLAAGRPCVASPVGMNKDVLAQGDVGLAAATQAEWVAALSSILSDRRGAEALGAAGRRLVEAKYSLRALAPRLAHIIRGIVN